MHNIPSVILLQLFFHQLLTLVTLFVLLLKNKGSAESEGQVAVTDLNVSRSSCTPGEPSVMQVRGEHQSHRCSLNRLELNLLKTVESSVDL